jgi:hypothetical protein
MVAGISGARPGSGAAVGDDEPKLKPVLQPAKQTANAETMARLATERALPDLFMGIPRTQFHGRTRPAAKRKTSTGAMTSDKLRRWPAIGFPNTILYCSHQGLNHLA